MSKPRITTPRGATAAAAALLLAALPACSHAYRTSYESCVHDPGAYRNDMRRVGYTTDDGAVWWQDWGGGRAPPPRPTLTLTMTVHDCLYSVQAQGDGVAWGQGGFVSLDEGSFRQDRSGRRAAFVAFGPDRAYAVIDGQKSPAWAEITWPPVFSRNGRHVGYLAKDASGGVAIVDGQVVARAPSFHKSFFDVLDSGGFAAAPLRDDGTYEVVVGDRRTGTFTDLCESRGAVVTPSGHFAVVGKRGGTYVTVVDGEEIAAPGFPSRCWVAFSHDERRWAYAAVAADSKQDPQGAVVDGHFYPVPANEGLDVSFLWDLAYVRTTKVLGNSIHGPSKFENVLWLVDLMTPLPAPTEDDYHPPDNGVTQQWDRVRIGTSLGPRFDQVDLESVHLDDQGHVRYAGTRGAARVDVIDNVIIPQPSTDVAAPDTPAEGPSRPSAGSP